MSARRRSGRSQHEVDRHRRVVSLRLPRHQIDELDRAAADRGISRAALAAELLETQLLELAEPA